MTLEQFYLAKELQERLSFLESQLILWENSKEITVNTTLLAKNNNGTTVELDTTLIKFSQLQFDTVASIKKEIDSIKKEFVNL